MGYWTAGGDIDGPTMERIGPWFDLYVGTDGRVSDLYAAWVTHGARKIVLCAGATLSADLTITANTTIWSMFDPEELTLGAKKIIVSGCRVTLAGFRLANAGAGIEVVSSGKVFIDRVTVDNATLDGLLITSALNDQTIRDSRFMNNGRDGIRITPACHPQIKGCLCHGNTGWGINDIGDSAIITGGRVAANTAGQIDGTVTQAGVKTT